MSTHSIIAILAIIYCTITNGRLDQTFFYGVEWTSSIPNSELIEGDTLAVREIALHADNKIIDITPTVTGFQDDSIVSDGSYKKSTYPITHKFSVQWDFGGKSLPIDFIKIVTNCGDRNPSSFCGNSSNLIFNLSSNGREAVFNVPLAENIVIVKLYTYDNECDNNTLILDESHPDQTSTCSRLPCSECFNHYDVDIDTMTMNTSSIYSLSSSFTNDIEQCDCPSFELELQDDHQLQVWHGGNYVGLLTRRLSQHSRVQMTWTHWMGEETQCRHFYIPNIDDFMTVSSLEALALTFIFNHTDGPLYVNETNASLQIELFELEVEESLNELFNLSWVYDVNLYELVDDSIPDQDIYTYEIYIESAEQKYSYNTLIIQSIYNESRDLIYDHLITIISDSFATNSTYITEIESYDDMIYSDNDTCHTYFILDDPEEEEASNIAVIAAILGTLGAILLLAAILSLIMYKRHLGCFKREWDVKLPGKSVDISDPKHVYEGQLEVGKKGKKIPLTTDGYATTNGTTGTHKPGEASGSNQRIPTLSPHMKTASIRIINDMPPDHQASLRAKSISHADVIEVGNKKIRRNVSERILPQSLPDGGLQVHASVKYNTDKTKSSNGIGRDSAEIYSSAKRHPTGNKLGKSWDYSGGRQSTYKPQQDNEYVYNQVNQYSSPESTPNGGSGSSNGSKRKMLELESIPHDKAINGNGNNMNNNNNSKIDDALNQAKRSNKVIEFTDFNKELKLIKLIGKGSFGKVYKAKWDAEFVAVKLFTNISPITSSHNDMQVATTQQSAGLGYGASNSLGNNGLAVDHLQITTVDDEQYKELYAEIVLATSIPPHPNIVRINGFCRKPLCVVMEYMGGGSVQKLVYGLTKKPIPNVTEKFVILVKACYGLAKLTEYGLHHRDVAARNILLGEYKTSIDDNTKVKITDFGMTRKDSGDDKVQKTKNESGPLKWMAPESIQEQKYNEKTDVYMWGITMWEIMYGREPYENEDAINSAMHVCMKNERPEFLWDLPSGLKTLIKKCWEKEPDKRPTFKFVAKQLEKLSRSMQSDIQENREMDEIVEEEHHEKEKQQEAYDNIQRIDSMLSDSGQYDEF